MLAFTCDNCGQLVFFDNTACLSCGSPLGLPVGVGVVTLTDLGDGTYAAHHDENATPRWRRCANAEMLTCNWLIEVGSPDHLCRSCELTRTLPDFDDPDAVRALAVAEAAKRRLIFQLDGLGLAVVGRRHDPDTGLAFDLLSSRFGPVTTGHADGVITIDLAESDDAHREWLRTTMGESYRTMLGHLRHEVGHYYWMLFARRSDQLARIRELFGDDTVDYAAALQRHYDNGPSSGWESEYVSNYASCHPWEDWAETFAHYLHIRATMESAASFGVLVQGPPALAATPRAREFRSDPARASGAAPVESFESMIAEWLPLTYALNEINRAMGKRPLYPFVLQPRVIEKLGLVHQLCLEAHLPAVGVATDALQG